MRYKGIYLLVMFIANMYVWDGRGDWYDYFVVTWVAEKNKLCE